MSNKKSRRQNEIVTLLRGSPSMRVNELAKKLSVTSETIRRDLDDMHNQGVLERTYGGAILHMPLEPGLNVRHSLLVREREAIAKQVVNEIKGAHHFMVGSGATTVHIARRMAAELTDITVIVHSFGVATELIHNPTIRVLMAPGFYNGTEGANHGAHTIKFLESFSVDYAILSASGLTHEGPSDALIDAGEVYSTMISRAFKTILAADKSKFNLVFPAHYAKWNNIDYLVSDQSPDEDLTVKIKENNVEIQIASVGMV